MSDHNQSRRRTWLTIMLFIVGMRAFAGGAEIDSQVHASGDPHGVAVFEMFEHSHPTSHDSDNSSAHVHCHNGCSHAPMVEPTLPTVVGSCHMIVSGLYTPQAICSLATELFRPPIS